MADNHPVKLPGPAADKRLAILAVSCWYFLPILLQSYPLSRALLPRRIFPCPAASPSPRLSSLFSRPNIPVATLKSIASSKGVSAFSATATSPEWARPSSKTPASATTSAATNKPWCTPPPPSPKPASASAPSPAPLPSAPAQPTCSPAPPPQPSTESRFFSSLATSPPPPPPPPFSSTWNLP